MRPGGGGMRNLLIPRSHIGRFFFGCDVRTARKIFFMMRNKISGHRVILCGILWWHNGWLLAFLTISGLVQIYLAASDLIKPYPYYQKYSKTPSLSVEEHKKQRDDTLDQSVSFFFWYLYPFVFFALWLTPFLLVFENSNTGASLNQVWQEGCF